jgi:hypothetical protein
MEEEEVYEGDYYSTRDFGGWIFLGLSWICREELSLGVGRFSTGALVCWRFWAWGPGYPYDILELGSCPSWQGG